jgi:hypothetical protein
MSLTFICVIHFYRAKSVSVQGCSSAALLAYMKGTYMIVGIQSEEYRIGTTVGYKCARLVPQAIKEKYAVFDSISENWIPRRLRIQMIRRTLEIMGTAINLYGICNQEKMMNLEIGLIVSGAKNVIRDYR